MVKNLSIEKSVKRFVENWVDEQADPFASWMFQSVLHWNVVMLIADSTFNIFEISFEDICLKINHRVGSRTSIQNIIKVGIEKNFFIKNLQKMIIEKKCFSSQRKGSIILLISLRKMLKLMYTNSYTKLFFYFFCAQRPREIFF